MTSQRSIPYPEVRDALSRAGWLSIASLYGGIHWVRGDRRLIVHVNGDPKRTSDDALDVIGSTYAPADILGGRLQALDRLVIAAG